MDLEIFALSRDFENLSPQVNLEIFLLTEDFENLSPRVDLENFAGCHSSELRAMQSLESVLVLAQTEFIKYNRVSRIKFSDRSLINKNYRELESVHH
ncbi:hypothetical protein V1477_018221 [Vespula maculifrons]|uniref:Uncharacterized protein n=1 Tax=Vespula maculifrons TaxID=7453 RepID=A0ABD2AYU8_VESMC